jgi:hypothetical protein
MVTPFGRKDYLHLRTSSLDAIKAAICYTTDTIVKQLSIITIIYCTTRNNRMKHSAGNHTTRFCQVEDATKQWPEWFVYISRER